jgi:hypothetical protein
LRGAAFASSIHGPVSFGPNIEIIAAKLTAVIDGETRWLIINLPPCHLKSLLALVGFPAWCLGRNPSGQILCISYAQELADKLSRDCRRIVASDWYRRVFAARLAPWHQAVPEFETTAQGSRIATSVGGVLTGRGADIIIIEDPLKPGEALSDTHRQGRQRMVRPYPLQSPQRQAAGCDRADHAPSAREPALGLDPRDDLVGHVLAQEDWKIVRLPAIAEDDERVALTPYWGHVASTGCAARHCTWSVSHCRWSSRSGGRLANNLPGTSSRGSPANTSRCDLRRPVRRRSGRGTG